MANFIALLFFLGETLLGNPNSDVFEDEEKFCISLGQGGVNESLMFPEHEGYHHIISTREAQKRLKQRGGFCYLTRYSRRKQSYILSIYKSNPTKTFKHLIIDKYRGDGGSEQFKIRDKDKAFNSIQEMLAYYEKNAIDPDFKNIGRKYTEDEYMRNCCCTLL